ncbi:bacteriocin immunity protein [Pseudomonas wadenswilerensis]
MERKSRLENYTESEFLRLVTIFFKNDTSLTGDEYGVYIDGLIDHFEAVTEITGGSDLIYYPAEGEEDSPEGVVKRVKEWRAANGKPGFKPA